MKYNFRYYLHDNYTRGELEWYLADPKYGNLPKEIASELAERQPFYELTLDCEYDSETKEVKILNATP